ncbi:MAG: alanyl-tRNA editing protein [Candidatus Diapherotrites archaeon]|nr:alanyl-tRNA editing protein [Candidatus Diapherotrites archaeon]
MTEKLYLMDHCCRDFDAIVVSVADGKFVVLDKTAFYPQGGGQPSDTGRLAAESGEEFKVVFVKKFPDSVSHEVDKPGLAAGMRVKGIVDWDRRYRHMRMHTAAHIIHGVIFSELGLLVSGNQLGWPQSRIDINIENFDREKFAKIEKKCNETIAKNLEISFRFISKDEALGNLDYFRLMGVDRHQLIDRLGDEIRIVKIGDFDESIDGGTHVRNTREIGKIKFVRFENKGAANRRIYFELTD